MELDLDNIQGNIVPGFNKDHQAFMLLRFHEAPLGRAWLRELQPDVASASEVQAFKALFASIRERRTGKPDVDNGAKSVVRATWLNLGISFSGLTFITGVWLTRGFSSVFQRSRVPGVEPTELFETHALLLVAADDPGDLEAALMRQRERFGVYRIEEVATLRGDTLPGQLVGHEHFGFKDAVSQPALAGTSFGKGPPVAVGEFLLGYADEAGATSGGGLPDWTRDGSFLVLLQLEQHVRAFRDALSRDSHSPDSSSDRLASEIVGRRFNGCPVSEPPSRLSHVGRAYPRWVGKEANRHRMIRRGIPYGPLLLDGAPDDGQRGLLFVCYQSDIARQFEHVWSHYLNASDFPLPGAGTDALVGQSGLVADGQYAGVPAASLMRTAVRSRPVLVADPDGRATRHSFPAFVTPRLGAYFFAPSIRALCELATPNHSH